jgi:predicted transcriptional regulator
MVETSTAQADGSAYTWLYVYDSPKGGNMISIMIDQEGEVSQFPGMSAFRKSISDFVDSDQAMAAAVEAGLKTHEFGMTMSLKSADRAEWSIPGSDLVYSIDAATGKFLSKE